MCTNINICKPQEYPGLLRSYVNRKIDLIKKNKKIRVLITNRLIFKFDLLSRNLMAISVNFGFDS